MAVRQTYTPDANVSARSPIDFAAHVKTEEINAVTSGLVKSSEANKLKAAEVDMASAVLKDGNHATLSGVGRSTANMAGGAVSKGVEISNEIIDGNAGSEAGGGVPTLLKVGGPLAYVHHRRAKARALEAAQKAGEAPAPAQAAQAATSARSAVLNTMKEASGTAKATAAEASLGSTVVVDAVEKGAVTQTARRAGIPNPLQSPLQEGKIVAKGSAEALAKTKSALIGTNAAHAGTSATAAQSIATRATAVIKEAIQAIAAMAGSSLAPIAVVAMAIIVIIALIASILGGAAMMGEPGGERMAQVAIQQYDKWNSSSADTQNEMRRTYQSAGGVGDGQPWCSCFVTWCWKTCGFDQQMGLPSNPAWAASWLPFCDNPAMGKVIEYNSDYKPQPGDIIVDGAKDASWSNHVGLVVSGLNENGTFRVIHGNWSDAVGQAYYFPGQTGGQGEGFTYVARPNYPDVNGTTLGEGVDFSMSESAFVNEWGPRINNWFNSWDPNAPLAGYGEEFARAAYRNKYDPRLSPAMSRMESGGGRYCFRSHNAWGWGQASWSSWPEAIEAHVSGLTNGYSNMTITEIVNKYCPDGNEATYIANLEQWIPEM